MPIADLRKNLLPLVAAVALSLGLAATGPARAQMPMTVTLDGPTVEAVIASYADIKAEAEALSAQYGGMDGGGDNISAFGALLAYGDVKSRLDGVVQGHGFADFQTWVAAFSSVATAYAFSQGQGAAGEMEQALASIRDNPDLTEQQKQMMIQQIQASMGVMAAMQPPQENIDAVAAHGAEIEAMLED